MSLDHAWRESDIAAVRGANSCRSIMFQPYRDPARTSDPLDTRPCIERSGARETVSPARSCARGTHSARAPPSARCSWSPANRSHSRVPPIRTRDRNSGAGAPGSARGGPGTGDLRGGMRRRTPRPPPRGRPATGRPAAARAPRRHRSPATPARRRAASGTRPAPAAPERSSAPTAQVRRRGAPAPPAVRAPQQAPRAPPRPAPAATGTASRRRQHGLARAQVRPREDDRGERDERRPRGRRCPTARGRAAAAVLRAPCPSRRRGAAVLAPARRGSPPRSLSCAAACLHTIRSTTSSSCSTARRPRTSARRC